MFDFPKFSLIVRKGRMSGIPRAYIKKIFTTPHDPNYELKILKGNGFGSLPKPSRSIMPKGPPIKNVAVFDFS